MPHQLRHFPFPITTPRLLLRKPCIEDSRAVNAGVEESFDELHQFMPWARQRQTLQETELFIEQAVTNWIVQKSEEPWFPIFIFDRTTQEFIGATGYHHIEWESMCLHIGYWIRTSKSGQGLMTEAVNALTRYAVEELGMRRVAITCDIKNIRSQKVAQRLGFALEATLKADRVMVDDQISDTLVFARYSTADLPALEVSW
ncbi:GNAT family N-acetyltransferase [Candidatus Babeliales bacterium]|nr:GNAT family N-acetyltransferase [Candidatus Babeliales bacterium]